MPELPDNLPNDLRDRPYTDRAEMRQNLARLQGKRGQLDDLAAGQGGLMRAEADAGPIGGLPRIGHRIAVFEQGGKKLVREVRV